jgi:hypothetical protein
VRAPRTRARGPQTVDLGRALIDPAATFATPDAVTRATGFSRRTKLEILCRWAYDSAELSVAEDEGMAGGESVDLGAVLQALDRITDVDVQHSAPTKHAAFCVAEAENRSQRTHGGAAARGDLPSSRDESPGRRVLRRGKPE